MSDALRLTHQRSIEMISSGPVDLEGLIKFFLESPDDTEGTSYRRTRTGFDVMHGNALGWGYFGGSAPEFMVATRICEELKHTSFYDKIQMMGVDGVFHVVDDGRELTGWRANSQPIHGKPWVYGLHITPAWV